MALLRTLALAVAAGTLVLTACSTGPTGPTAAGGDPTSAPADAGAFPVTIEHAFGQTTIASEPKRVATLGFSDQDQAVALGVVPVGATKIAYGGNAMGSTDFFDAAVAKLAGKAPVRYSDTDGIPFAEVARTRPDLILATNSGLTRADYDKLTKIAPVVAYPTRPFLTPWRTSLETVGRALGRSAQAAAVLRQTESAIAAAKQAYPALPGTSFLLTALSTTDLSKIYLYGAEDTRVRALGDFGLQDVSTRAGLVKPGEFYATVSAERAADLTSDVLLTFLDQGTQLATYTKNPLIGRIPAVVRGNVYSSNDNVISEAITNPTPLSIPVIIDKVLPGIDAAVKGS